MPAKDHIKALIAAHQRRLQMLKAQQGASQDDANPVDPGILIEIDELEETLQELQHRLSAGNVENEDDIKRMVNKN